MRLSSSWKPAATATSYSYQLPATLHPTSSVFRTVHVVCSHSRKAFGPCLEGQMTYGSSKFCRSRELFAPFVMTFTVYRGRVYCTWYRTYYLPATNHLAFWHALGSPEEAEVGSPIYGLWIVDCLTSNLVLHGRSYPPTATHH